jgi:WD40 repeat protein
VVPKTTWKSLDIDVNQISDASQIEISHESLIQQWKELNTWKQEEIEAIKTYESLVERCKFETKYSILSFKYYLLQTATNAKNQKFCMARTLLNKTHEMNSHVSPSRKFSRNLMQNYIDFKGIQSSNHIDFSLSSNDTITNACCLPSKKSQIIIGTKKGYLIWYDIDKNKMIKTQKAHDKPITALMSQPDMNILVSASNDGILKLWSTTKSISEFKKWSFRDDKNNLDPVLPPENFTDNENQSEVFFLNDSSQFFFTMTHDARYIAYGSDAIIIRDLKTNKFVTKKMNCFYYNPIVILYFGTILKTKLQHQL